MRIVGERRERLPQKYQKKFGEWKRDLGKRQGEAEQEVVNQAMADPGSPFILLQVYNPDGPGGDPSAQGIAQAIMDKRRSPFDKTPGCWYSLAERLGASDTFRVWIVWEEGA